MISIRGIDHVVLRVKDIEAMRRFYCDVLGASHVAYRPELRMSHLRAGSCMIDLVAASHLERHGVAAGEMRNRYGAEGNGPSIYLTDPEGNRVELKGPSDGGPPPSRL